VLFRSLLLSDIFTMLAPEFGGDFLVATPSRDMFLAMSQDPGPFINRVQSRVDQDFDVLMSLDGCGQEQEGCAAFRVRSPVEGMGVDAVRDDPNDLSVKVHSFADRTRRCLRLCSA